MSNYRKLNNQPLKVVIAEVRFSPILNYKEYIPKFQDSIRQDFPILKKSTIQDVKIDGSELTLGKTDAYNFLSEDMEVGVEISSSRFVFYTKKYNRFEGFGNQLKKILEKVIEIIKPSLLTRIGLRYSNTIEFSENENINHYLENDFQVPISISNVGKIIVHKNEIQLLSEIGVLLIRLMTGRTKKSIFPDLDSMPLDFKSTKPSLKAFLDIDHAYNPNEKSIKFDCEFISKQFEKLHEGIRSSFWSITSKSARDDKWT